MKKFPLILIIIIFSLSVNITSAQSLITTAAGNGTNGYSGDGGPATAAELSQPWSVATDSSGNLYIADYNNSRIRKVTPLGIITTFAGNDTNGYSGDGGPATAAELNFPTGVATDNAGNLYIADENNERIRKVSAAGTITTFAGNGTTGFSGDGGQATSAEFDKPVAVATDNLGNVYVGDFYNFRVRKINNSDTITTIAGNGSYGYSGDGGAATSAAFGDIVGVAADNTGDIFVADETNARVRKISTTGIVTTLAGNGTQSYSGDGGPATSAELSYPYGVAADNVGNVYIADYVNHRIREVTTSGIIFTIAGDSIQGYSGDGGWATDAELDAPTSVALHDGVIYIADNGNNVIRKLTPFEGISNMAASNQQVSVYPNPASDGIFTLALNGHTRQVENKITIYTLAGKEIYIAKFYMPQTVFKINLSNRPAGVYLYSIATETSKIITTGRLVISR